MSVISHRENVMTTASTASSLVIARQSALNLELLIQVFLCYYSITLISVDKPAASTYEPADLDDTDLHDNIEKGLMFDKFFEQDVLITIDGRKKENPEAFEYVQLFLLCS